MDYCCVDFCIVGGIIEGCKIVVMCEVYMVDFFVYNLIGFVLMVVCLYLNMVSLNVLV